MKKRIQNKKIKKKIQTYKDMEKELRYNPTIRLQEDSRTIEGIAMCFNSESEDLGFIEKITKDAIDDDTIKRSDIFCYLNHDESRGVLARSKNGNGSLKLWLEDDGLHYRFTAPKTALGDEVLSYLERGEITGSSFAFTIADNGDKWERAKDGKLLRTISKIDKLFDVSPVFQPAYNSTSVSRRKFELSEKLDFLQKEIEKI